MRDDVLESWHELDAFFGLEADESWLTLRCRQCGEALTFSHYAAPWIVLDIAGLHLFTEHGIGPAPGGGSVRGGIAI